ncbi:AI-2E family transporter [Kocuria sp. M4R2S49]|uniref:AI-2E family transporter n=1 Tax=Kocuria rhizosphaericola TaxID=3376284 RepID=UPI003792AB5E
MWAARLGRTTVRVLLMVLGLVLAMVAGYALWRLRLVVIPLLIALLLAAAISPLVRWMYRRNVPRALATWISMLAAVTVVGAVVTGVVWAVSNQWHQLVSSSNLGFSRLERLVAEGPLPFTTGDLRQVRDAALDYLRDHLSFSNAFSTLSLLATLTVGLLLAVVVLFFFLKDGPRIWAFLLQPMDADRRAKATRAGRDALETMGGYVRGITLVALVDAVGIGVVLLVLGVPLALPLAAIVFLGAYVPIIGATLSGAFAVLVTFVTNTAQDALIVAIAVIVVQQLEGNILQPLIMGHVLSLHPLVVLIALTAGSILAGIAGAVLAVPLTAVAWTATTSWRKEPATEEPATPASG